MHPLERSIVAVWRIKLAIAGSIAFLAGVAYDVSNLFDVDRAFPLGLVPAGIAVASGAVVASLPRLRYRFWRFRLTEEELLLERGVLNRVRTIVPLSRVQHIDVSQDMVEREFGLGKLIVHTAGTRSSEIILPGLRLEDAERLRDRIRTYILDDVV